MGAYEPMLHPPQTPPIQEIIKQLRDGRHGLGFLIMREVSPHGSPILWCCRRMRVFLSTIVMGIGTCEPHNARFHAPMFEPATFHYCGFLFMCGVQVYLTRSSSACSEKP